MKLAAICIFIVALPHCSKTKSENSPFIPINECRNYTLNSETTRLCFDEVITDSRCPHTVDCIWAGTAAARFTFNKGNESHSIILATNPVANLYSKDTIVAGYKIEFIDLQPYPGTSSNPLPSDRKAEVKLTRL